MKSVIYTFLPELLVDRYYLSDIISEIENNTCVRYKYVPTAVPTEAENKNKICYVHDFSHLLVNVQSNNIDLSLK